MIGTPPPGCALASTFSDLPPVQFSGLLLNRRDLAVGSEWESSGDGASAPLHGRPGGVGDLADEPAEAERETVRLVMLLGQPGQQLLQIPIALQI